MAYNEPTSMRERLEALGEWLISHRTWVCDQTAAELATEHIATIEAALARKSEQSAAPRVGIRTADLRIPSELLLLVSGDKIMGPKVIAAITMLYEHAQMLERRLDSLQDKRASAAQELESSGDNVRANKSASEPAQSEAQPESRSQLRRIAAMKGEDAPTFESAPAGELTLAEAELLLGKFAVQAMQLDFSEVSEWCMAVKVEFPDGAPIVRITDFSRKLTGKEE